MSNLLNKNPKKKLLERGPQISPSNQFQLEQTEAHVSEVPKQPTKNKEKPLERKASSVRVRKSTRDKLNALVSLNKADTIDELIEIMIEEYFSAHVTKEEKKQFDLVMELYRSRN